MGLPFFHSCSPPFFEVNAAVSLSCTTKIVASFFGTFHKPRDQFGFSIADIVTIFP